MADGRLFSINNERTPLVSAAASAALPAELYHSPDERSLSHERVLRNIFTTPRPSPEVQSQIAAAKVAFQNLTFDEQVEAWMRVLKNPVSYKTNMRAILLSGMATQACVLAVTALLGLGIWSMIATGRADFGGFLSDFRNAPVPASNITCGELYKVHELMWDVDFQDKFGFLANNATIAFFVFCAGVMHHAYNANEDKQNIIIPFGIVALLAGVILGVCTFMPIYYIQGAIEKSDEFGYKSASTEDLVPPVKASLETWLRINNIAYSDAKIKTIIRAIKDHEILQASMENRLQKKSAILSARVEGLTYLSAIPKDALTIVLAFADLITRTEKIENKIASQPIPFGRLNIDSQPEVRIARSQRR